MGAVQPSSISSEVDGTELNSAIEQEVARSEGEGQGGNSEENPSESPTDTSTDARSTRSSSRRHANPTRSRSSRDESDNRRLTRQVSSADAEEVTVSSRNNEQASRSEQHSNTSSQTDRATRTADIPIITITDSEKPIRDPFEGAAVETTSAEQYIDEDEPDPRYTFSRAGKLIPALRDPFDFPTQQFRDMMSVQHQHPPQSRTRVSSRRAREAYESYHLKQAAASSSPQTPPNQIMGGEGWTYEMPDRPVLAPLSLASRPSDRNRDSYSEWPAAGLGVQYTSSDRPPSTSHVEQAQPVGPSLSQEAFSATSSAEEFQQWIAKRDAESKAKADAAATSPPKKPIAAQSCIDLVKELDNIHAWALEKLAQESKPTRSIRGSNVARGRGTGRHSSSRIHNATAKWLRGDDWRDSIRWDFMRAPHSGRLFKFRRRGKDGEFITPRRGSNPPHFDTLNHDAEDALLGRDSSRFVKPSTHRSQSASRVDSLRFLKVDGAAEYYEDRAEVEAELKVRNEGMISNSTSADYGYPLTSSMPTTANMSAARQAPSPGQSQQQQNQQQINGTSAASQQAVLANGMPHAGHQTDINHLWGVVQELSDILSQNRAQTAAIVSSVQQIQARAQESDTEPTIQQTNGELQANRAAEIANLHDRLHRVTRQRDELLAENEDCSRILGDYENTMQGLMSKIRTYALEHTKAVTLVHKHYNSLLETEREANLQMRLEHGQWQAALGRASEFARQALRERSKELEPLEIKNKELKMENKVLRRLVGWEVTEDSDDEEMATQSKQAAVIEGSAPVIPEID